MKTAVLKVGRGIRWYLKQATGEAKWDDYLGECRSKGLEPMPRRDFEWHRTDHKENNPQSRCC
jgi:hypothetical protein